MLNLIMNVTVVMLSSVFSIFYFGMLYKHIDDVIGMLYGLAWVIWTLLVYVYTEIYFYNLTIYTEKLLNGVF